MAKYKFTTDLSVKGIENVKKKLLQYRNVELPEKCKRLVSRLAEIGITVAKTNINESPLGKYVTLDVDISSDKMGCKAILLAVGATKESQGFAPFNTLLAIEFGAGIFNNPVANPNADKLGFGVGTFPGQMHAFEDGWWYWDEKMQEWRYTHGVKATMPMYHASLEMQNQIVSIVREVFK